MTEEHSSPSRSNRRKRLTPKQRVLKMFRMACLRQRRGDGMYVVMQSVISWGEPVGADGRTPREAWAKAAANLSNWRRYG